MPIDRKNTSNQLVLGGVRRKKELNANLSGTELVQNYNLGSTVLCFLGCG